MRQNKNLVVGVTNSLKDNCFLLLYTPNSSHKECRTFKCYIAQPINQNVSTCSYVTNHKLITKIGTECRRLFM